MKRILLITGGVLLIVIAAIAIVPFLVPKEVYKTRIEAVAKQALGRDVLLAGDVNISVFPQIAAEVGDVTVANAEGFEGDYLVKAGSLRAAVRWGPLLSRRIEVEEIAFVDADVRLLVNEDGATNWEFGAAGETGGEPADTDTLNAGIDRARLVNAAVLYDDAGSGARYELTELNIEASARSLDEKLTAKGDGVLDAVRFDFDLALDSPNALTAGEAAQLDLTLRSALADVSYLGGVTLADDIGFDGRFQAELGDINEALAFLDMEIAGAELLERVRAAGTAAGSLDDLTASGLEVSLNSGAFEASYAGSFAMKGEAQSVDGRFDFRTADAEALITALAIELPAATAFKSVQARGQVAGPVSALRFAGLDVTTDSPLLSTTYKGSASLAEGGPLEGAVTARSDRLRPLLAAADVELAPGDTLQSFNFTGNVGGTLSSIRMTGLSAQIDEYSARGSAGVAMDRARPLVTADLAMGALDLTAFLGDPPEDAPLGWSKEPMDLSSLGLVDADIALAAESLTVDKVTLRDADLMATLRDGKLDTQLNQFKVFGGAWAGDLDLDTTGSVPTVSMNFSGNSILMEELIKTFTGLDRLAGTGQFQFRATARGASIDDIMNDLDGSLTADLANGVLRGVDLGKVIQSAQSFTSGSLLDSIRGGQLDLGLSPAAQTQFASFDSILTIRDGVARIDKMQMVNQVLEANGLGSIDLGGQTLDMTLRLAADTTGQGNAVDIQLNNVGIPIRITGNWLKPSIAPDTAALANALTSGALDRVTGGLSQRLGGSGDAGAIVGDIINRATGQQPAGRTDGTDTAQPSTPVSPEDLARDAAREALGGLFGRRRQPEPEEAETDPPR